MNRRIIFYAAISFLFIFPTGCKKDEIPKPLPEQGYPTVYQPLSPAEWETQNAEFQKINIYDGLNLNEYGFVRGWVELDTGIAINAQLVISEVQGLINRYYYFMGIKDPVPVNVESELWTYAFPNIQIDVKNYFITEMEREIVTHNFNLTQETVENKTIDFTELHFGLSLTDKKLGISGNWFPDVFIPKEKIYTKQEAISIAVEYGRKNTDERFSVSDENTDTKLKYIPVQREKKIELHECWCVTFWDISHRFYIDTQTGEIIKFIDYSGYI